MIHINTLILATEKEGGLFDLDGTLGLVALQFLVLMFLLNSILYTPLLGVINDRNQYINKNLANASTILVDSKQLLQKYESHLAKARKEAQVEISNVQKLYKHIFAEETKINQRRVDEFISKLNQHLHTKKAKALAGLQGEVENLTSQILSKILA